MPAIARAISAAFSHWIVLGAIYGVCGILVVAGLLFAIIGAEYMLTLRVGEPTASFIVAGSLLLLGLLVVLTVGAQSRPIASSLKRISRRAQMAVPDRVAIQDGVTETLKTPSVQIAALLGGALVFGATKLLEAMRSMEPKYEILPPVRQRRFIAEDINTRDAAEALVAALNRDARSITQRTVDAAGEAAPQIGQFATRAAKWLVNAAIAEGNAIRDSSFLERIRRRRSFTDHASRPLLDVIPATRQGLLLTAAVLTIVFLVQKSGK